MIKKSSALILVNDKLLAVRKEGNKSHLILPGGKIEKYETPSEALVRELEEEINIKCKHSDLVFIDEFFTNSQFENQKLQTYLFHLKIDNLPSGFTVGNEISSYEWISLDCQNRRDLSSGIRDFALSEAKKIGYAKKS